MFWWRRDPMLSPLHRYAQRLLRSHEADLRTRCFSRTPPKSAKHDDDDGSKRPTGMSNLEWMQLQHYNQWRKRLRDDPYQAIFGASNDMLSGKGLKDWEWISKSFPKWMVREMGMDGGPEKDKGREYSKRSNSEESSSAQLKNDRRTSADSRFSKRDEVTTEGDVNSRRQESHFPQPSFRASRIDRDYSIGIISPSDLRRPREQPYVKVVGPALEIQPAQNTDTHGANYSHNAPTTAASPVSRSLKGTKSASNGTPNVQSDMPVGAEPSSKISASESSLSEDGESARESAFIEQFLAEASVRASPFTQGFLADGPQYKDSDRGDQTDGNTWKQTALERRSSRGFLARIEAKPSQPTALTTCSESTAVDIKSTQAVKEVAEEGKSIDATSKNTDSVTHQKPLTFAPEPRTEDSTGLPRSTSKILNQLPKDDIDFLSADEIRVSMGAKRRKILRDEQRRAKREKLEETFKDTHKKGQELDPMIEAKIINDQIVRRLERELRPAKESDDPIETRAEQEAANGSPIVETPIESSIDRMKKWLEQGGAIFSSHFWQDPTEEADATKTKLFFDKVMARVRKGRVAMREIAEGLETDVPATKPLLKRLRQDEDMLDGAIQALRLQSGTGKPQALTPRRLRAIQALRFRFQDTDRELEAAYATLQNIENTDAVKSASFAFKRRLSLASKISHKSASLTRYLIWSIQARLEDTEVDQSRLVHYKAVANSLLTLRDTQVALAQLVARAMLVYRVVPDSIPNVDVTGQSYGVGLSSDAAELAGQRVSPITSQDDKAKIRANVAADEHLAHEVEAQKSAMRGLSDDGYVRTPKFASKTFDERSPLANSLFRPFGPVLESLGKETSQTTETVKANEDTEKELDDANLVAEIKQAYEDTYGPITVGHRQLVDATEVTKIEQEKGVTSFEMLKEDPVSNPPTAVSVDPPTEENIVKISETTTVPPIETAKQSSAVLPETMAPEVATPRTVPTTFTDGAREAGPPPAAVTESTTSPAATTAAEFNTTYLQPTSETLSENTPSSSAANLATHYTILIHDPKTDNLSITTFTTGPPRDASPVLPLHQALSTLDTPSKFIPHITEKLEVITAKKDMLVLRNALDDTSSIRSFETVRVTSSTTLNDPLDTARNTANSIDGTARLSPTGYVGPDERIEQLEKEIAKRNEAAGKIGSKDNERQERSQEQEHETKRTKGGRKKRGVVARVFRGVVTLVQVTIGTAAVCYVIGDIWGTFYRPRG